MEIMYWSSSNGQIELMMTLRDARGASHHRKSVAFREWLGFIGAQCEKLPDGSFKQSGTGVASRMVVIQRRESSDVGAMVAEYQAETGCDWSSALVACNAD